MAISVPERRRTLVYATVLYWHARELPLLTRALASLSSLNCGGIDLSVILIDNGCGDTPPLPADPRFELIRVPENRGFAGGHNLGLRHAMAARADYVLLFNSDAVAEPDTLRALVTAADADRSAAFVGPLILRATAANCVESAGQSFSTVLGRHREIARGRSVASMGESPRRVDAVSGCAMLARVSALDAIGLLDERLFIYFEDMDWCLRARRAGYSVVVEPRARVHHIGSGSMGTLSDISTYYSVRNHMLIARNYGGRLPEALAVGYHLAYLAHTPARRTKRHFAALVRGAFDACTGRLGAAPFGADRT